MKRSIVQKWCIANEFELVELLPQQQDDDEDGKGQIYKICSEFVSFI